MTLDGTLSPTNDLASVNASAFILLLLYDKGTLDPNASLLGSNLIGAPYLWTIGNSQVQLFYTPQGGTSTPSRRRALSIPFRRASLRTSPPAGISTGCSCLARADSPVKAKVLISIWRTP